VRTVPTSNPKIVEADKIGTPLPPQKKDLTAHVHSLIEAN